MGNVIEIEVINWDKYNPRSDRGGYSWFRMDNQFFLHMRQRKGYSAVSTQVMAFLLAEASANNGKPFKLRIGFAADILGYSVEAVKNALQELLNGDDVIFKPLEAGCTLTDGRTDVYIAHSDSEETIEEEKLPVESFDIALAEYKKLPGVTKGAKAESRFEDQIRNQETFQTLLQAIENYRAYLGRKENSWRSPKTSFENFLGTKRSGFFWREFTLPIDAQGDLAAPQPLGTIEDLIGGQKNAS